VYTRNGGGNRDHWDDDREPGIDCDCTGCIATYRLPAHGLYISDADDDFDCTYATFYFDVPEKYAAEVLEVAVDPVNMSQQWGNAIEAIGKSGKE